ncbi:MAG TPA: hypothetical protein VED17_06420 [Nitrososphaerales archaeon]|nr:hypothetical protein [Nitrososphaerales archaeon]
MGKEISVSVEESASVEGQTDPLAEIVVLLRQSLRELKKISKHKGRGYDVDARWLNLANAARYCDYSPGHFRDLAKEFEIPTCGPRDNHFRRLDLDRWMEDPRCFKSPYSRVSRRRTGEFKIKDFMQNSVDSDFTLDENEWVYVGSSTEDE